MDSDNSKRTRSNREASPSPHTSCRPLCTKSTNQVANSSQLQNGRQEKKYQETFISETKRSQHFNNKAFSSIPVHVESKNTVQMPNTSDQVRPSFINVPTSRFVRRVAWLTVLQMGERQEMQEVTLAVLGGAKAGKSTFVQCALDMKALPISSCTTKKVSLEGIVSVLRLCEFQLKNVKISEDYSIIWPKLAGDEAKPRIDGALVLFDVMDQISLYEVTDLLSKSQAFLVVNIRSSLFDFIFTASEFSLPYQHLEYDFSKHTHRVYMVIRFIVKCCNPDYSRFFKMRQQSQGLADRSARDRKHLQHYWRHSIIPNLGEFS